jgi:DNA-binding XRE family transcriptional regulator
MRTSRSSVVLPIPVKNALRKLGRDIRDARRRRRIPAAIAAQRASISRTTLVKIEKGDPGVAIGIYATVLFVLGMADRLADLVAPKNDTVGLQLEEEHLPQRIRVAQKRPKDK